MATLISPRTKGTNRVFQHEFRSVSDNGAGYSFTCTEDGKTLCEWLDESTVRGTVDLDTMTLTSDDAFIPTSWANATNPDLYVYNGIVKEEWTYPIAAVYECDCGAEVEMEDSDENECDCGRVYNLFGQRIVPRNPGCHCGAYDGGWDCMCFEYESY